MIINGIAVSGATILTAAVFGVLWLLWRRDEGRHAAAFAGPVRVLEVHHEEYNQAPSRGDAQGRAVRVCATDSRPAARADLTGSLSPRPPMEGARPVSAPPAGHTHERAGGARTSPALALAALALTVTLRCYRPGGA